MIILGKDRNDKGKQLEQIARTMLTSKGYENIKLNPVGPGGCEYDVTGDYVMPIGVKTRRIKIIGECKAHLDPIDMTDWQKFLGKVYLESVRKKFTIAGLFIAASGVNRRVASSYEELREHQDNIELVDGSDIEEFLKQEYSVCGLQAVAATVTKFTDRGATAFNLCYYRMTCYWIVVFEKGVYTILTAAGHPLSSDKLPEVRGPLEHTEGLTRFVDMYEEAEATRRRIYAQKHSLAQLMLAQGNVIDETGLLNESPLGLLEGPPFTPEELNSATSLLAQQGWLESALEGGLRLAPFDNDGRYEHIVEVLKFWLNGYIMFSSLLEGLSSKFFDQHVAEALLREVMRIQGGLPIPLEQRQNVIRILKLSPKALNRALHPIEMIVNGRVGLNLEGEEGINEAHRSMFYAALMSGLVEDYRTKEMARYYCELRGVVELEHTQGVIAKNWRGVDVAMEAQSRHIIRTSNVQGGFIHLMVIGHQPEPWEEVGDKLQIDEDDRSQS